MDLQAQQGLMSTYREAWRNRGVGGWLISLALFVFYTLLYFTDVFKPLAEALHLHNKWFLYGLIYGIGMCVGGVYYLSHHGNSRYHKLRIAVNIFVQLGLAFALPWVLVAIGKPDYYFSYFWPLKYDALFPHTLQSLPVYFALYSVVGAFVIAPGLALIFGKRWYCSWVCGCGALANTFGDPFRHLTSKSTRAWVWEKRLVHSVLFLALIMTAMVMVGHLLSFKSESFLQLSETVKQTYGFVIGSILAGVLGTSLYPILGPRFWCRNFCPMAAMLGLIQKVGRFQITVKRDMCISCGNCSTYCEMGIDVRSYAQRNESFTRAACVGCGMCAHVCPRGVLRLENVTHNHTDKALQGLHTIDL